MAETEIVCIFLVNFENRFVKNEESEVPDLKNSLLLALATMKTFSDDE